MFHGSRLIGNLRVGAEGPGFAYEPDRLGSPGAFALSVRMPLGTGDFAPEVVQPWLANLLPEGRALPVAGRLLGTALDDVVGLLSRMGRDTAGAVSFGAPRSAGDVAYAPVPDAAALERIIEELPARPFLVGEDGVSMSLAGAQDKLPVAQTEGQLAVPVNGAPSTHILKPDIRRLDGSVQNEALCMVLAGMVLGNATEVTTGRAGARSYLLVTRYDREAGDGGYRRLHQEDFCQALGRPPGAKYQHNQAGVAGPSLADFFAMARRHVPVADLMRLRDAVIFNVLLTNVDSHAKNYSLLLSSSVAFAPLYDLLCGEAWDKVTRNMAQDVGGKRRGAHILQRHWRRMAASCGLNGTALVRRVGELAARSLDKVDAAAERVRAMPAGDHFGLALAVEVIKVRCRTVARNALDAAAAGPGDEDDGDDRPAGMVSI